MRAMSMYGPRPISESVPRVASQVFSRKYIMLGRLVTSWDEIVGPAMAGKTQPVKIRPYKKKDGKADMSAVSLDIACNSSDATVLHYQKDLILERINQIFGERWVTAIRFVPMAANNPPPRLPRRARLLSEGEKQQLSGMLEGVEDPEMLERLKNLGSAILQETPSGL